MENEPQVYAMALYFTVECGTTKYNLAILRDYSSKDEAYDVTIEQDTGVKAVNGGGIIKVWSRSGVPEWDQAISHGLETIAHLQAKASTDEEQTE